MRGRREPFEIAGLERRRTVRIAERRIRLGPRLPVAGGAASLKRRLHASAGRGRLDVIDDEDVHRTALRIELESELIPQRRHRGRTLHEESVSPASGRENRALYRALPDGKPAPLDPPADFASG